MTRQCHFNIDYRIVIEKVTFWLSDTGLNVYITMDRNGFLAVVVAMERRRGSRGWRCNNMGEIKHGGCNMVTMETFCISNMQSFN